MIEKERWQKIDSIYHQALTYDTDQRDEFLDQACDEDGDLRRDVDSLLQYDARVDGFIETPAIEVAARALAQNAHSKNSLPKEDVGPYHLLTLLGRGGTGDVYLAIDTRLGRKVAIKLLAADLGDDPERISRFKQEARATSTLNHPNIVTIFEIGEVDNQHYIVTEYVEGETLREFLARADKGLTVAQTVSIAGQLIDALDAAHKAGIIHRDIKPDNIIIRSNGFVKILDFGIAKLTSPGDSARTDHLTTRTGIVMGTASYMSPEQTRGQKVDHRTDIFAIGVLLYEMLSGRRPFDGDTWSDVIAAVLIKEPVRLDVNAPHVPPGLQRIVERCLEKAPENRFQSAADLAFSLKSFSENATSEQAQQKSGASRSRSYSKELIFVGTVVLLLLVVGAIWFARKMTTASEPQPKIERKALMSVGGNKTQLKWLDRSGNELDTVGEPAEYSGPALSANDNRIVVAINDPAVNGRDLWILSPGSKTRLTTERADDLNPLWTPDDQWIIYTSDRGGFRNIYRKRADNSGESEPVLQGQQDMNVEDLTRDGRLLIFNVRNKRDDAPTLALLSLGDGKRTSYNTSSSRAARFSPDGRWVAYQADAGIVVRRANSFALSKEYLVAGGNARTPMWRGDGKELFYLNNQTMMAVTISVEGSQLTASAPVPLFKANFEEEERRNRYAVSKDGQRFLVIVKDDG